MERRECSFILIWPSMNNNQYGYQIAHRAIGVLKLHTITFLCIYARIRALPSHSCITSFSLEHHQGLVRVERIFATLRSGPPQLSRGFNWLD